MSKKFDKVSIVFCALIVLQIYFQFGEREVNIAYKND